MWSSHPPRIQCCNIQFSVKEYNCCELSCHSGVNGLVPSLCKVLCTAFQLVSTRPTDDFNWCYPESNRVHGLFSPTSKTTLVSSARLPILSPKLRLPGSQTTPQVQQPNVRTLRLRFKSAAMQRAPSSHVKRVSALNTTATVTTHLTYICRPAHMRDLGRPLPQNQVYGEFLINSETSIYAKPSLMIVRAIWKYVGFFVILYSSPRCVLTVPR